MAAYMTNLNSLSEGEGECYW